MGEIPVVLHLGALNFNLTNCLSGTLMAIAVAWFVIWLARKVTLKPGKRQFVLEYIINFTDGIVRDNVPDQDARKHLSLYAFTLFLFIFMMNQLGLFLELTVNGHILIKSPTASPLITMTFAMMTLLLSFNFAMQRFGVGGYLKNYASPIGFLLPINVLEEFTNFLTLSLRLYGNIYAGEVLLTLIGHDFAHSAGIATVLASVPLAFIWQGFSVFIGSIQAYVFVTLSLVYIGRKVQKE